MATLKDSTDSNRKLLAAGGTFIQLFVGELVGLSIVAVCASAVLVVFAPQLSFQKAVHISSLGNCCCMVKMFIRTVYYLCYGFVKYISA